MKTNKEKLRARIIELLPEIGCDEQTESIQYKITITLADFMRAIPLTVAHGYDICVSDHGDFFYRNPGEHPPEMEGINPPIWDLRDDDLDHQNEAFVDWACEVMGT